MEPAVTVHDADRQPAEYVPPPDPTVEVIAPPREPVDVVDVAPAKKPPRLVPELDVMATMDGLMAELTLAERHRVIVWLAGRYMGVRVAGVAETSTPVRAEKAALIGAKAHRPAKTAHNKVGVRAGATKKAAAEKPSKSTNAPKDASAVARAVTTKKPKSATETFLIILQVLNTKNAAGASTRDVTDAAKAAKVKLPSPAYAAFAAGKQGLARRKNGLWTLTAAGTKRLGEMPRR